MKIKVLGSAAGGGFPQWNCNCSNCTAVRAKQPGFTARTQSSIAVSANGQDWLLVNASPDILQQLKSSPELQPARGPRDTGIVATMLMDAQIDHVTGLLMMREGKVPMELYCTGSVWEDLSTGLPLVSTLSHYCGVNWRPLPTDGQSAISIPQLPDIEFVPVPLISKAPPYSPNRYSPSVGDNVGLLITNKATGKTALYAPGLGEITPEFEAVMQSADVLLVDGTFWTEDEMVRLNFSKKMAADMGHLPQTGDNGGVEGGMIGVLNRMPASRKILIHINNTNPVLNELGPERALLTRHGIELAFDSMEIEL
ncbi:MAG: pyrroloquinoline quinone biosynthesis protein PqqB [Burkholderiales bacterium]|nr:pyrroloquinoline quinone biosynthesis protein PqqB [Burkholderiales bacterium]